ncbi:MAG: putative tpr repeat, sel1 subfamily [Verrucomicrobiales bacterium]|nr:putative tpr repeat, sel1 subfamily [Verrucomicrobiales bacterium]
MQDTKTTWDRFATPCRVLAVCLWLVLSGASGCVDAPQRVNPYLHNLRAQAEKGDPEAQYRYGWRCQVGWGVKENAREALWWYRQASQKNHALAIFRLGEFYRDGVEVRADSIEAYKWFRVAEKGGLPWGTQAINQISPKMRTQEIKMANERAEEWLQKFQKPKQ